MRTFWLHPAELFVARIVAIVIALDAALIALRGSSIDVAAYAKIALLVGLFLGLGLAYRRSGRSEAIGAMAVCTGLFIAFTASLSLFNYLLTPNPRPLIDPWLQAADSALGYHWPDAIAWAAEHPLFNEAMRFAYMATLPQIAVLVAVLGLTKRLEDLYSLLLTVTITGTIAVMFWGLFPSAGAKSFHHISSALLHLVRPVVDPAYGAEILALVKNGAPYLSPDEFRGLIAFPSFHIVLAVTATWHARHINWLFGPYLLVNLIVLPAVLVHGGHHLVDIPAGMAVFAFGLYCAREILHPAAARAAIPAT
jgi:hypothetical protein